MYSSGFSPWRSMVAASISVACMVVVLANAETTDWRTTRPSCYPSDGLARALGVRHHARHVPGLVADAGDGCRDPLGLAPSSSAPRRSVAENHLAVSLEALERLGRAK